MLIRYPGSKDKHLRLLAPYLDEGVQESRTVVEPFAGTAAITFKLLAGKQVDSYHINDIDSGLASLWLAVREQVEELKTLVLRYEPNVADFYEFKEELGQGQRLNPEAALQTGFKKLVLHQISYSGLGGKAGGPLGGRHQRSAYGVDCRWNPNRLLKGIEHCHELLNSVDGKITSSSWESVLDSTPSDSFIYLDPPYYDKGQELYLAGRLDHDLLAKRLRDFSTWVLSYDDVDEVRALYPWATVERLDVRSHLHHGMVGDLVILP